MPAKKPSRILLLIALLVFIMACSLARPAATPTTSQAEKTVVSSTGSPPPTQAANPPRPSPEPGVPGTGGAPAPAPAPTLPHLKVVYVKERNLWSWAKGQSRQLTASNDAYQPRLSDDGKLVAYLRPVDDFHTELWVVDANGGKERRLVSVADLDTIGGGVRDPAAVAIQPYHFSWVPGSHTLAFNTYQLFAGPGSSLLLDLNLVDADTLKLTNLFLSGWGGEFVFSPDGKQVALSTDSKIFLTDSNGKNYRQVMEYKPVATYNESRYYARPVWSPDGSFLRVAIPPIDPLANPPQPTTLWKIPTNGTPPSQEASHTAVPFSESSVAYSPDLKRIAYLVEIGKPSENLRELHLATYDGGGGWVYQKASQLKFVAWSPDGAHFAFSTGVDPLMWLGSDQKNAVPFSSDPTGIMSLRWVDARDALYIKETGGTYEFYLGSLDGGETLLDTLPQPLAYDFSG